MPALNEEKNISSAINETLKAFDIMNIRGEVIVLNDGSSDNTPNLVLEAKKQDNRVKLVNHDSPWGIGGSFWDGVEKAEGEIVTMLPGDNENDPLETLRYTDLLEHVDIVIPFVYNRQVRSVFRNILSAVYRQIINTTFRTNLNYTNGTVIYRKSILSKLKFKSSGFFFQTDMLIRLLRQGYLFAEVPYRLSTRKSGKSKALSYPSFVKVVKGYLKLLSDIYLSKNQGRNLLNRPSRGSLTSKRLILDQAHRNKIKHGI